jgi:hypothetical protein
MIAKIAEQVGDPVEIKILECVHAQTSLKMHNSCWHNTWEKVELRVFKQVRGTSKRTSQG